MTTAELDPEAFRREIDRSIVLLFAQVIEALSQATAALLGQDVLLAEAVIEGDRSIDRRCEELTGLLKGGLADAARDPEVLETLVDVLQMVPELERSADLAEHIARRTLGGLGGAITPRSRGLIQSMGEAAIGMWRSVAQAYEEQSRSSGFELSEADDRLDGLALGLVAEGGQGSEPQIAADLALIARFYERLGDHAVNLARRIDAMATPRRLSTDLFFSASRSTAEVVAPSPPPARGLIGRLRRFRLAPTDDRFFELFRRAAVNCRDCADELNKLTTSLSDVSVHCDRIRTLENRGDQITVEVLRRLDESFITPYDREDIHALIEELDDVVDYVLAAASLIELADLSEPLTELNEQTGVLVEMTEEMVALMENLRSGKGARHRLERIEHLERQGDAAHRQALRRLFSGEYHPLDVIMWKDVVQAVEDSLNAVEDVADVVESILVKGT